MTISTVTTRCLMCNTPIVAFSQQAHDECLAAHVAHSHPSPAPQPTFIEEPMLCESVFDTICPGETSLPSAKNGLKSA